MQPCPICHKKGLSITLSKKVCRFCGYKEVAEYDGLGREKALLPRNGKQEIVFLQQSLALECTQCQNSYSGVAMLRAKGHAMQCRLKKCNRKGHIKKTKALERLKS